MAEIHYLDDPNTYETLDPSRFRDRIFGLSEQCVSAWSTGMDLVLPSYYKDVNNVVVCGVGGSAIGGEPVSYTHLRAHETRGNLV